MRELTNALITDYWIIDYYFFYEVWHAEPQLSP